MGGFIMLETMLYHGSTKIIKRPEYGKGNTHNDYGLGFYCTENIELAKEWACSSKIGGFANEYSIDISELNILQLDAPEYGILHWLAILVNNRIFSIDAPIIEEGKEYLTAHFLPDVSRFDIVKGYRADDSYFTFATDFLSNTISFSQLCRAMRLGSLGEQVMLRSRKSFEKLRFVKSEPADGALYFVKRNERDKQAREQYLKRERISPRQRNDIFMLDILREEIKHGDERLQTDIS
jgi:hypothetical protein